MMDQADGWMFCRDRSRQGPTNQVLPHPIGHGITDDRLVPNILDAAKGNQPCAEAAY
jgi:hypothetical protein